MRVLSTAALAAVQSRSLPLAILVEMDLTQPLFVNTGSLDLVIGGVTYFGTKGLGSIDAVNDSASEIKQLSFTLSGVPSTSIALALTEPVQGRAVRIKLAGFDPSSYQPIFTDIRWAGWLDVMTIDDGGSTSTINVTAEHAGIDLTRPGNSLYTDLEQQRLNPGDTSMQYLIDQVEQRIVWPAASWGKK